MPVRLSLLCLVVATLAGARATRAAEPLRVLLVAGGCCHDYATQSQLLKQGIESRVRAHVEVAYNPDTSNGARFDVYAADDWDRGYDVVVHDECSSAVTDRAYVERVLAAHRRGTPAVNIHCAMHCYRGSHGPTPVAIGSDDAAWYEMIGLQSHGHGPQHPIAIAFTDRSHPIVRPLADWTTIDEELYDNIQVLPSARVLARGGQSLPATPGQPSDPAEVKAAVVWTNEYGPNHTRIFSTSLGHNNETVGDDRYLDLVTRGLVWAAGRLAADGSIAPALRTTAGGVPAAAP